MLASSSAAPTVAVGDTGSIALGYADSSPATVLTGTVIAVRHTLHGLTRLTVADGGARLAALRLSQSYEQQAAGDIAGDLAGRVALATDTLESGTTFPFYVLDDGRSAYAHLAALARACGFLAHITPDGALSFAPYHAGEPAQTFTYGGDILALDVAEAAPTTGAITAYGEGAAGTAGADAWSWLVKDPSTVRSSAGSGDPARSFADRSLRSADAVQTAAAGAAAMVGQLALTGTLLTTGAPAAQVGKTIAIKGAPQDALNGSFLVRGVRHRYSKREGFITLLLVARASSDSPNGLAALAASLSPF
jgi:phage protein D